MMNNNKMVLPAEQGRRGLFLKVCERLALESVTLTPGQASASLLYPGHSVSGPILGASNQAHNSAMAEETGSGNSLNVDCRFSRLATRRVLGNGHPSSRWLIAASAVWRTFEKENIRLNQSENRI
jgi:hypothetical protein